MLHPASAILKASRCPRLWIKNVTRPIYHLSHRVARWPRYEGYLGDLTTMHFKDVAVACVLRSFTPGEILVLSLGRPVSPGLTVFIDKASKVHHKKGCR